MTSSPDTLTRFTDAAADAVAREIATIRREAVRERELRDAHFTARMAELEARVASVAELERRLAERLATVKDGEAGPQGEPGADGERGADGASVTIEDLEPVIRERVDAAREMIMEEMRAAVASIPVPRDGRDADPEDIRQMVDAAVSALPPAQPGKDADPAAVAALVAQEVERAVAAIPAPQDGKSVTIEDIAPLVDQAVRAAVAEIPVPKDGVDGKDGERGPEGPAGALPIVAEWQDKVYYQGEIVTRDGSVFQAVRDTGKDPSHDDWRCIVARGTDGRDGQDGRSFNIRGTWLEINEYQRMDVVALGGASFAAKRDNPGPCPGDGWQLIAAQGKRGSPGEAGRPGLKGERGDPAQAIISATVDEEGLQTLISGDGTRVQCDLYPVLARLKQ